LSMEDATEGKYYLSAETYDLFFTKICEVLS